MLLESAFS